MPRITRISQKSVFRICAICVIGGVFFVARARAERKYVLGTSVDFMGGVTNQARGLDLSRLGEGVFPFYSVYPSISLSSTGQRSTIDLDYTFTGEYFQTTPRLTTTSHAFTGSFTTQLSRTARLRLSDTFSTTPDYYTINVLKGFTFTPEGFQYVFEPQLYLRSQISNSANLGLDIDLNPKSTLTFTASGSYLHYEDAVFRSNFYNQMRIEGSLAFSRRMSGRQTLGINYRIWQNDYEDYDKVRSHAATLSLSRELSPDVHLALEAGPSFTEKTELMNSYVSCFASAQISKQLDKNLFSAGYSYRPGDSTGLGTVSDSHQGTLGFSRTLWRKGSINFQASAFTQSQRSTDVHDYWGAHGSLALSRQFGEHWVASVGGSYMTYLGQTGNYYNYADKRVYVSFGFRLPELLRGQY
jgi:hypothetical protein